MNSHPRGRNAKAWQPKDYLTRRIAAPTRPKPKPGSVDPLFGRIDAYAQAKNRRTRKR